MSIDRDPAIKADAAPVLLNLRHAFREALARMPESAQRAKDLQQLLGVEYKLCWQVLNIVKTEDPLAISQYVPGVTSVNKFLAALRQREVSEDLLANVDRAMQQFQLLVKTHSIDRRGFDSMVTAISGGEGAELIALQHRRDAFRNESQIWGAQVDTFLRQMIVKKADHGPGFDRVFVAAKSGLCCLRQGVMPILHGYRDTRAGGRVSADQVQPLDVAAAEKYGAPVVPEFCTQPIPKFKTIQSSDGWIHNILDSEEIGHKGSVNMVFAGVVRNLKMERDESGLAALLCGATFITPTQLTVLELFVHRASFGELVPQAWIHATASGSEIPEVVRMSQPLPIYDKVVCLSPAKKVPTVGEVPAYRQLFRHTFEKLGWNPAEFDLFRLRIPYPILHTRARIACPVSEKIAKALLSRARRPKGRVTANLS